MKSNYDSNFNSEAVKISALSTGKIDKNEYPTGKKYQSRMNEQTKFSYSVLRKTFEKQTKAIEDEGRKPEKVSKVLKPAEQQEEPKSIKDILPKELQNNEIKKDSNKIKNQNKKLIEMISFMKQKLYI